MKRWWECRNPGTATKQPSIFPVSGLMSNCDNFPRSSSVPSSDTVIPAQAENRTCMCRRIASTYTETKVTEETKEIDEWKYPWSLWSPLTLRSHSHPWIFHLENGIIETTHAPLCWNLSSGARQEPREGTRYSAWQNPSEKIQFR